MERRRLRGLGLAVVLCALACAPSGGAQPGGAGDVTGQPGGSSTTGGGDPGGNGNPDVPPAATRGASVPYWEVEAEDATTNGVRGVVIGPSRTFGDLASEASARSAVKL